MHRDGTPRIPDRVRRLLSEFPGPVFLAAHADAGWRTQWGASSTDGQPSEAHVSYRSETGAFVLSVRTVLPEPVPPPTIRTVVTLSSALLEVRRAAARPSGPNKRNLHPHTTDEFRSQFESAVRDEAAAPELRRVIRIDETEVAGRRKDFPDCSIAEVPWTGDIRILCAGDTTVIDRLQLRSLPGIPVDE